MADASPKDAAAPSASLVKELKEPAFPQLPPMALTAQPTATVSAAPASSPSVRVLVPDRGTLAAGKYEATPAIIWIVVASGAILLLGWALFRVRRAAAERRRREEALTTVRKSSPSAS